MKTGKIVVSISKLMLPDVPRSSKPSSTKKKAHARAAVVSASADGQMETHLMAFTNLLTADCL